MAYLFTKILLLPILRLFIRDVEGLKNIPKNKPFILVANHDSYLEPFLINTIIIPYIDGVVHFLAMRGRSHNWFGPVGDFAFKNWSQCVALEKGEEGKNKALKELLGLLKKGKPIALFPGGIRSSNGRLRRGKTGAARLALLAKVPVIPVGLIGTYHLCPREKLIPKFKRIVKLRIGKPLHFNKYYDKKISKRILRLITYKIMLEIAGLTGKKYLYRP